VVPFKSGGESVTSVVAGNVQATSEASIVVIPQIKAGKLKAIACTYEKRITAFPELSTAKEQGYPQVDIGHWAGLFAPKDTPKEIVEKMSAEIYAVVKSQDFADKLVPKGIEPAPYTLKEYVHFIATERERLGRIAKAAHMQAD
ncbi:MAG TPA: tripartite tricarboxylate transporter substrate-binding protein, partial [Usitatibacter sp.]|nr:tripartite tricarboxylate transporter substrate-binding protein [Usitatibacter sp.]